MNHHRRAFLHLAGVAAALIGIPQAARAQAYPSRPVRLVVGFPAGGPNDTLGRIIAQWLTERLGQPFVVENQPGTSGNIATAAVVRAPADGYTLLLVGPANAISGSLYPNLEFNFLRDIAPVAGITREALVMLVHPSVPARTVSEFIAYAKADPGRIKMASTGNGSSPHVSGELFKIMTGLDLAVVHYAGGGPALKAMIDGQAQMMFEPMSASIEPIKSGKLRALAVTTASALGGAARCPDPRRCRAGLRGECGDRHRRAQEHAGRCHRHAQHGDQCGFRGCQDAGAARRYRRQRTPRFARRFRQASRRRDRKMGEGGQGIRHQGELAHVPENACPGLDPRWVPVFR